MKTIKGLTLAVVAASAFAAASVSEARSTYPRSEPNYDAQPYSNYRGLRNRYPSVVANSFEMYEAFWRTCNERARNLGLTKTIAQRDAIAGRWDRAAKKLNEALQYEAQTVASMTALPAPFTAMIILEAAYIAEETIKAADAVKLRLRKPNPLNPPPFLPPPFEMANSGVALDQVKTIVLDSLYTAVLNAVQIDEQYFESITRRCYSRWSDCYRYDYNFDFLPPGYFDGVRKVAVSLMEAHNSTAHLQYDNELELKIAQLVTESAKAVLMSSVGRRSLRCEIYALHDVNHYIGYVLKGNNSLTLDEEVYLIRSDLNHIQNNLESSCGPRRY